MDATGKIVFIQLRSITVTHLNHCHTLKQAISIDYSGYNKQT